MGYYAGGQRIAMKDGGVNRTLLGDHLGSTAYTVSGTSETGELRYRAFGATRFTSGTTPTTFRYTGQREEAGLGLYYYGARWYDPALGRFVQADTIVPHPGDAQAYDRYAYVNNNPLKYTDPSGRCGMLAELGESFTSPFAEACMGMSAGAGLSRRAKAALSAGGGLTAAAALNAGLATGSPPSQADALPPLLESVPGQVAGASSTSFPLADGGPQTTIPASTGVYNNTLNVLADPLPGVDPTGHIYASSQQQGWKVGDPITNLTSKGTSPSWSAVRSRYWKNEAYNHPERWDKSNLERMQRGLAPQRINPVTGKLESMELHHNPAQREGGLFEVEPLWPGEHANVDPYRRVSQ